MENRYFNRELSWLEFNARVLHQALRRELPLMERLQFLSIVTSNFDEFFQVRVASLKRQFFENPDIADISGLNPQMVLTSISARAHQIVRSQQECLMSDILPSLAGQGLVYIAPEAYSQTQAEYLHSLFDSDIYPLLTPLRTDTEPFPNIKNLSVYVAFLLKPISGIRSNSQELRGSDELPRIAFVEIPSGISTVFWLPGERGAVSTGKPFALLQDIITLCGTNLFPGFEVEESLLFKVARDADFAVDEDSGNFITAMEDVLIQRKSSFPVQMGLASDMVDAVVEQ